VSDKAYHHLMSMVSARKCPNCGANLCYEGGLHCAYCDTWFEEKKHHDWLDGIEAKLAVGAYEVFGQEEVIFYSDGEPYYSTTRGLL